MGYPIVEFASIENKQKCLFVIATTNETFKYEMTTALEQENILDYVTAIQ